MSKITFRADEDMVKLLEEQDESKSEAIRSALKLYLGQEDSEQVPEGYVATKDLQAMHHMGSRGDYDEAEEVIDSYKEKGLEIEAALMENYLNSYR